jgi:hypothetical protein
LLFVLSPDSKMVKKHQNGMKTDKVLRFLSIKVEFFHFW